MIFAYYEDDPYCFYLYKLILPNKIIIMSVIYKKEEFQPIIKNNLLTLELSGKGIKDISEIKNLETLTELQVLNLSNNQIDEIKGLDNLTKLKELNLYNNKVTEIKGLRNLINLRKINLEKNSFINIKGFENQINLQNLSLGAKWVKLGSDGKPIKIEDELLRLISPLKKGGRRALILNGKELGGIEKDIVKSNAKNIVAYCRVKLKQSGYTKGLVPASIEIGKLEQKIAKMVKKYENMLRKAKLKREQYEKRLKQKQDYSMVRRT